MAGGVNSTNNSLLGGTIPDLGDVDFTNNNSKEVDSFFKQMKIKMDKFTKDWNENESNRDKALTAFNKMTATKEEIQDSLKLMIERDGKLEEAIAKG